MQIVDAEDVVPGDVLVIGERGSRLRVAKSDVAGVGRQRIHGFYERGGEDVFDVDRLHRFAVAERGEDA